MGNGGCGQSTGVALCRSFLLTLFSCLSVAPSHELRSFRKNRLQRGLSTGSRGNTHLLRTGPFHPLPRGLPVGCGGIPAPGPGAPPPSLLLPWPWCSRGCSSHVFPWLLPAGQRSSLSPTRLPRGATSVTAGLGCAVWRGCCGTGWNRPEPAVSGCGQPWRRLTEVPADDAWAPAHSSTCTVTW